MRRYLAALLRLTAEHLDPLPESTATPCPLPHWPTTPGPAPMYPQGPIEWMCGTSTSPDRTLADWTINTPLGAPEL